MKKYYCTQCGTKSHLGSHSQELNLFQVSLPAITKKWTWQRFVYPITVRCLGCPSGDNAHHLSADNRVTACSAIGTVNKN